MSGGGHKLTVILKINKCTEPFTATATIRLPGRDLDWSHTFKDGEKAKLPVLPSSFSGLGVTDATLFIKVGLKKMNGSNLNYTVSRPSRTVWPHLKSCQLVKLFLKSFNMLQKTGLNNE